MKDTNIPLDLIFIDNELEVISVKQGVPNSEDFISEDNVMYVLELNVDSGVKKGDELEFISDKKVKMQILDSNGESQMDLEGGERIVSRKETIVLIRKAKKADVFKSDSSYKSLGKYIINVINKQEARDPEFVESKK